MPAGQPNSTKKPNDFALDVGLNLSLALRLGIVDFKASEGWLSRLKHRQHLSFKSVSGEAGTVDSTVTKNFVDERLREILRKYKPENRFQII